MCISTKPQTTPNKMTNTLTSETTIIDANTINSIDANTINSILNFAIEKNNPSLFADTLNKYPNSNLEEVLKNAVENRCVTIVKNILTKHSPNNIEECLKIALKHKHETIIEYLINKLQPVVETKTVVEKETTTSTTKFRKYEHLNLESQLMIDIESNKQKAIKDLRSGIVSIEEINHDRDTNVRGTVLQWLSFIGNSAEDYLILEEVVKMCAKLTSRHFQNHPLTYCKNNECIKILLKHPEIDINDGVLKTIIGNIGKNGNDIGDQILETLILYKKDEYFSKIFSSYVPMKYIGVFLKCYPDKCLKFNIESIKDNKNGEILNILSKSGGVFKLDKS